MIAGNMEGNIISHRLTNKQRFHPYLEKLTCFHLSVYASLGGLIFELIPFNYPTNQSRRERLSQLVLKIFSLLHPPQCWTRFLQIWIGRGQLLWARSWWRRKSWRKSCPSFVRGLSSKYIKWPKQARRHRWFPRLLCLHFCCCLLVTIAKCCN